MEKRERHINVFLERMTKDMIIILGTLNGTNIEESDIDDEMITHLTEQIQINTQAVIQYAKARELDEQARRDETGNRELTPND